MDLPMRLTLLASFCLGSISIVDSALATTIDPGDEHSYTVLLERVEAHRLLLVGEIHGTAQTPALIAGLATRMAVSERPLLVGLEIPRDEQKRLQGFLTSAGTEQDRDKLLAGDFWQRDYQDGRSSAAMLELLESLRALALKRDVQVLAFDVPATAKTTGALRDQRMAEHIASALKASPRARGLILAGNFHTRIQDSAPWDPKFRFMGHHLQEFDPYAIEVIGISGSAWICTGEDVDSCKARDTPANNLEPGLELGDEINDRGHHGIWKLKVSEMSAPAKAAVAASAD